MPLGFLIMLPFVGFAEETGWRDFLQPELEERTFYLDNDCKDIWSWSEKVYEFVKKYSKAYD